MHCQHCGAAQPGNARFCIYCGRRIVGGEGPWRSGPPSAVGEDEHRSTADPGVPAEQAVRLPSAPDGAERPAAQPASAAISLDDPTSPPLPVIEEAGPDEVPSVPVEAPSVPVEAPPTAEVERPPGDGDRPAVEHTASNGGMMRSDAALDLGPRFGERREWADSPLRGVSPAIYQLNAFRVLDLPISATAQQVDRQARRLSILQRLGSANSNGGLLPLPGTQGPEAIREALRRIHDPGTRIVDEVFWLWPLGQAESEDEALDRLRKGDRDGAIEVWRRADEAGQGDWIPCHNLAVFYHALALELEPVVAGAAPASKDKGAQLASYWRESLRYWERLCESDAFWKRLADRIRELDDPRLTTGFARRIRGDLPRVLLWINAVLAARYAQSGDGQRVKAHVALIRQAGFDSGVANEVLRQAALPYREQVKAACDTAERETDKVPESGDAVSSRLLDETRDLLAVIDQLLPRGDTVRETAHDELAVTVMRCYIGYANKTDQWGRSVALLEQALKIAESASMRQKIEENLAICRIKLEHANCWFCKKQPADKSAAIEVKMHKVTERIPIYRGTRVQYQTAAVPVPRCQECKSAHSATDTSTALGLLLGIIIAVACCLPIAFVNPGAAVVVAIIAALVLAVLGAAVGRRLGSSTFPEILPESTKNDFPAIKKLKQEGFSFGAQPSG